MTSDVEELTMPIKKLYQILGVHDGDDLTIIQKAYRKLALEHHPDRNPDNRKAAEEKFKEIAAAYNILGDEEKRKKYDQGLINNNGEEISVQPTPNPKSPHRQENDNNHPRQHTMSHEQAHAFRGVQPEPTFFKPPKPEAFYYFFNSARYAQEFAAQQAHPLQPVFLYVTQTPLQQLFISILNLLDIPSAQKISFKPEKPEQPAYISIQSNALLQMERVIDQLIADMIILQPVKTGHLTNNYRDDRDYNAGI